MTIHARPCPPIVLTDMDAVALTNGVLDALEALEPLILEETELLKLGQTNEALALTAEKSERARAYVQAIEILKSNAIAVQRLRPDAMTLIRERHEAFGSILAHNMQVLATARSVSESIIREVSAEVAKAASPEGYTANLRASKGGKRLASAPLAVSKTV